MAADYLNYVLSNPDLRENAEAAGLTNAEMAAWGQVHWENHGEAEGRQNNPNEIAFEAGYTETLGPEHYQGRDAQEVLQASVRAGDPSEMWEAREDIRPEWNLGQYTAEGWNLAPDTPYKTGILGDTIAVNPDIGQLVPTAAGNQRFLQDRYVDASIANDFPVGWTTAENAWAGPEDLGNYWDVLTNATRDDTGILGRVDPYDPATAVGPSVSPGTRGGGNIRPDRGGAGYGGALIGGPATGGPPNPTVPSFGYPQYQDWTRFMPTNFQLAEGGGKHYQQFVNPYMTGGGGGNFVARPNPTFTTGGGGTGGGTGGGFTGVNTGGNNSGVTTDASGNRWVMTPGGQFVPADSDYGQGLLGTGRLFYDQHYDSSGAYMGSEGSTTWGEITSGPQEGKMGWINRHTGELEPRPKWGIQLPGPGENIFATKRVLSEDLPYYQTEKGLRDPWAPAISNKDWSSQNALQNSIAANNLLAASNQAQAQVAFNAPMTSIDTPNRDSQIGFTAPIHTFTPEQEGILSKFAADQNDLQRLYGQTNIPTEGLSNLLRGGGFQVRSPGVAIDTSAVRSGRGF